MLGLSVARAANNRVMELKGCEDSFQKKYARGVFPNFRPTY